MSVCTSPLCKKEFQGAPRFCPFCGADQEGPTPQENVHVDAPPHTKSPQTEAPRERQKGRASTYSQSGYSFLMRASEELWHMELDEPVRPGRRRQFVVIDEEYAHIVIPDKYLSMADVCQRTQALVRELQIPVRVQLESAAWFSDTSEARQRVVASSESATADDIKMVMGLDYFGSWASLWIAFGYEPEPFPEMPKPVTNSMKNVMLILGIVTLPICIGIFFLSLYAKMEKADKEKSAQARAEAHQAHAIQSLRKNMRTFRFDDIRLFRSAMAIVFKTVVDDIVEKGGKVIRIEAGGGRLLAKDGLTTSNAPLQTPSVADLGL